MQFTSYKNIKLYKKNKKKSKKVFVFVWFAFLKISYKQSKKTQTQNNAHTKNDRIFFQAMFHHKLCILKAKDKLMY